MTEAGPVKRIGIVDDQADVLAVYRLLFRKAENIKITLHAKTAEAALRRIARARLDLVIIDISLPGMNGLDLARKLRRRFPGLKILIVTGYDKKTFQSASLEAGADGIITKNNGIEMVAETRRLLRILPAR